MPYPQLAGSRDVAVAADIQLHLGDAPIVTDSAPALADIQKNQVCVLTATGVTPYVVATHGAIVPDKLVVAHMAVLSGQQCPIWTAGKFNHNALVWPAGVATYAARKELVLGSMIGIDHPKPPSA